MRILITGAGGFLGRALVARATAAGHDVTALVRRIDAHAPSFDPAVTLLHGDLRTKGEWSESLAQVEVVVHAAAAAGGDRSQQLANTVVATERLLDALGEGAPPTRFVHISSFSVYDFHSLPSGSRLDERAPLEARPDERDAYTEAKMVQENLVRRWCTEREVPCVIVRPGAIVGPGKAWDYGASLTMGRLAFVIAPRARFRLIALHNCADAIVRAITVEPGDVETINLVDDELPTHAEFFRRCQQAGAPHRILVPVPWRLIDALGRLLRTVSDRLLGGRLRTPELLDHRRQEARWKPFSYPNDKAHRVLGWRSEQPLVETIRRVVDSAAAAGRG